MSNPSGKNQYNSGNASLARQWHKSAKKDFARDVTGRNTVAPTSAQGRSDIARQLKILRSATYASHGVLAESRGSTAQQRISETVNNAAASTHLRNLAKRKK